MSIDELLDRRAITPRLSARSKRQALSLVAEAAARRFDMDAAVVLDALLAREQAGSTGVGAGVAVPHAKLDGLDKMRGVFVRLEAPVDFDSVDGQPVDLLFALFAPPDAGSEAQAPRRSARERDSPASSLAARRTRSDRRAQRRQCLSGCPVRPRHRVTG